MGTPKTYVVEHLDPECGPWSTLEYVAIATESTEAGAHFCLSSAPQGLHLPELLRDTKGLQVTHEGVEDIYRDCKDRVCLLDPAAKDELNPTDADVFNVFVFGGILVPLNQIQYVDHPEIRIDEHESTQMPFRYVKDSQGRPVMPEGMLELIKKDSDKGFEDLI
ncbi:MAG: hypothetical protein LQ350_004644 [Teloschistes chrysophthalmus]|nr:MAG: hypothetical protein LQ350_004644 [Niorma chrysophthalma]